MRKQKMILTSIDDCKRRLDSGKCSKDKELELQMKIQEHEMELDMTEEDCWI